MSTVTLPTPQLISLLRKLGAISQARPIRLALEPRVVFDAAGTAVAADVVVAAAESHASEAPGSDTAAAASGTDAANLAQALADSGPAPAASSIVFIDASVTDPDTLANAAQPDAEVVLLSGDRDGLEQIAAYLNGRTGIGAIHILSHGEAGELKLGSSTVTTPSIAGEHADELATIRGALADDADILIYGCAVSEGEKGQTFIEALTQATGADIAASTSDTGAAALGGDWELETHTGPIEALAIDAPEWSSLLAPLNVSPVGTGGVTAMTVAQQLMGANVTVVSATLYGQPYQAGVFSGATGYAPSWLAFDSGVIFSTGDALLPTTNSTSGYSAGLSDFGVGGQADFAAIGGNSSHNASYIDITFVPTSERIAIQFVFGSDEYNEYVYSGFADAMAIWVNGTNIAVTPTGSPISIDTINQSGTFTPLAGASAAPSLYVNNSTNAYATEMDGFTRTLGAMITVNANVANTIRLGISDIGDGAFDSWLLVKADSVQAKLISQNDVVGTTLNTPVTFDVLANDIDYGGDAKTIVNIADQPVSIGQTITLASGATVKLNADGTLTVTPALNSPLQELFTYAISDGNGNTATAYATVNIVAGTPPALDLDASAAGASHATAYSVGGAGVAIADIDATLTDANNITRATIGIAGSFDGDLLTVGTLPAGVTVDPSSTATSVVLIGNVSPASMAAAIKAVVYSNTSPAPDTTDRLISVQVTDATGLSSAIAQTMISMNTVPVAAADGPVPVVPGIGKTIDVLANDSDADGDALAVTHIDGASVAAGGAITLASGTEVRRNADGTLTIVMHPGATAAESFTYTVSDGNGGTATSTLAIEVEGNTGLGSLALEASTPTVVAETTSGDQSPPRIVVLNDGRLLYVWSNNALTDDTTTMTIQGRILNADGTAASNQFQIGTRAVEGTDGYDVDNLDVDVLAGGRVVVSWQRSFIHLQGEEPVFTILDPTLNPGDAGFVVVQDIEPQQNDVTTVESPPTTVALADGRFMVVWYRDATSDNVSSMVVRARIFDANGTASTNEFQIGTWAVDGTDGYDVPNLTATQLAGGNVVVAWVRSFGSPGGDEPVFAVVDPTKNPGDAGFMVAQDIEMQQTDVTTFESPPVITALADGRLMGAWVRNGLNDDTTMDARGRIFNADGTAASDEFDLTDLAVDGYDPFDTAEFSLTQLDDGRVVFGFVSTGAQVNPYVTIVDPSKSAGDPAFFVARDVQINITATSNASYAHPPVITAMAGGRFAAAWTDEWASNGHLRVRLFDSSGRALTGERQITTTTNNYVSASDSLDWDNVTIVATGADRVQVGWVGVDDGNGTGVFTATVEVEVLSSLEPTMPVVVAQDTTGHQSPPRIVTLDDGRLLHVWSNNALSDNTTAMTVEGRILNADGTAATSQFQIGTWAVDGNDEYDVDNLDVDVLGNGNVVVSYVRSFASGTDEPVFTVINPAVAPGGAGFVVVQDVEMQQNDVTTFESPPTTVALADGRFMAVWWRDGLNDNGAQMVARARIFNADGTASTTEFQLGTFAVDGFDAFDVPNLTAAQLSGGNVVVGWVRNTSNSGADEPVFAIVDPSKAPGDAGFVVAQDVEMQQSDVTTYESPPVITALGDGRFMGTWLRNGASDDTTSMVMRGRIFNADGTAATDEFQLGDLAVDGSDHFDVPQFTISELSDGRVVVGFMESWASVPGSAQPYFTIIDPSLAPSASGFTVAADVRINTDITAASVAMGAPVILAMPGADGRFVAAWFNASGGDGHLVARMFDSSGCAVSEERQITTTNFDIVSGNDGFDWDNVALSAIDETSFAIGWVGLNDGNGTGVFTSVVEVVDLETIAPAVPDVVAQNTSGDQSPPKIVKLDDGRLFYVWSNNALTDDNTTMTIHGRIINADGSAATNQFQIGTLAVDGTDGYDVDQLDVDVLAGGRVVVSWQRSFANAGDDEPVFTIIDPSVAPGAPGFVVVQDVEAQQNDVTTLESPPTTVALADGRFMVVWWRDGLNDNGTQMLARARIFNADGAASTNEFQLGTFAVDGFDPFDVPNLTATQLAGGGVVVGWGVS